MTTLTAGAIGQLGRHIAQRLLDRSGGSLRAFQRGFELAAG
jgi:nucleoside-diphosphate-sugar epimerase